MEAGWCLRVFSELTSGWILTVQGDYNCPIGEKQASLQCIGMGIETHNLTGNVPEVCSLGLG